MRGSSAAALAALLLVGRAEATAVEATGGLSADVAVLIADVPDPVDPFAPLTYLVSVDNLGPDPASAVTLVQDLPFTTGVVITPSQGTCGLVGNQVQCDLQAIPPASGAMVQIDLVAPGTPGFYLTTATVSAVEPDANPANNTWVESTEVAVPELFVDDVAMLEGDAGDTVLAFTVFLTTSSQATVTVDYATADGSATVADLDYDAASGTLTFDPGILDQQVVVTIHGDTKHESDEAFTLELSNAVNANIQDDQGQAAILNDDPAPTVTVGDVSIAEGDAGTTNAVFDITLSAAAGAPIVVEYATANGTATAGVDYAPASGTLTFAPGSTLQSVSVAVNGDAVAESDETFFLELPHDLLYAANLLDDDISAYEIDAVTGAIAEVPGSPFPTGGAPLSIRLDPQGRYAYASSVVLDSLFGFAVDGATGSLTPLPGSPWAAGTDPVGMAVDPTGRFVYVANSASDDVSGYGIDPTTGDLSPLPGSPYLAGDGPAFVAIDPTGRFAYVVNSNSDDVSAYVIDAITGELQPVQGLPVQPGDGPTGVAVDPTGQYAYVASRTSADVWGYSIDPVTGALTDVPGGPVPGASGAVVAGVAVDPSGLYVYAVGDSDVTYGYSIDPADGSLTAVPGSPFVPPNNAAVTADPSGRYLYAGAFQDAQIPGWSIDGPTGDLVALPGSPFAASSPIALASARLAAARGTATILDDEGALTVSVGDATVPEGNAGSAAASFSVTLSAQSGSLVSVDFATADGTATVADGDYAAASGTLTFAPGQTTQAVDVAVNGDAGFEASETLFVNLTNPQGPALGDGQGLGTIVNDDAATTADSRVELVHGSSLRRSLGAVGSVAYDDYFRIREGARSSWEIVVDAATGDIGSSGPLLERIGTDGTTVLQSSVPAGAGSSRSLSFENASVSALDEYVRVRSLGCGVNCGPEDVYLLRAYETTLQVPRFNNSASQITVLVVQNVSDRTIAGNLWFRDASGVLAGSAALSLGPRGTQTLNTATVVSGVSGTIAISHDGRYGDLTGKAVAVEPATGFTFDTAVQPRPR